MAEVLSPSFDDAVLGFDPLRHIPAVQLIHSDRHIALVNCLGLFGTITPAGPATELDRDWRQTTISALSAAAEEQGLQQLINSFNPVKAKGEWTPDDAALESMHLARDAVIAIPVLDISSGQGSLAETGFAALGGIRRGQDVYHYLESGAQYGEAVERARALTRMIMDRTVADFPINSTSARSLEDLTDKTVEALTTRAQKTASRVLVEQKYTIPQDNTLRPEIALVGSGAASYDSSWHRHVVGELDGLDVPRDDIFSAYANNWDISFAAEELEHKTGDAVVLFAVTEDQLSYGAMGELGWLLTYCSLKGQKLGVYVEAHASEPKSPANRQRKLGMSHLTRHLQDFPDLPVFIAESPKQLALYGASELRKYQQLQRATQ